MEEAAVRNFSFVNRIYVRAEKTNKGKGIFIKLVIGAMILLFLFKSAMENVSVFKLLLPFLGLLAFLASGLRKSGGSAIKPAPISVSFFGDKLVLCYDNLDREDGMGSRREQYTLLYNNIQDIQFSVPMQCLKITCGPLLKVEFHKDPSEKSILKDFTNQRKPYDTYLYLTPDIKDEFISNLQYFSRKQVRELLG
jgi:hypothetical protein